LHHLEATKKAANKSEKGPLRSAKSYFDDFSEVDAMIFL